MEESQNKKYESLEKPPEPVTSDQLINDCIFQTQYTDSKQSSINQSYPVSRIQYPSSILQYPASIISKF